MKQLGMTLLLVVSPCIGARHGSAQAAAPAGPTASAVLHADQPGPIVNRNIYGHFAEHLGRCIYEGIWVGRGLPDPEHARHPQRRGRGAEEARASRCCAGRAAASPTSTTGRTASARARSGPSMINTHWGGVVENNTFGTHEFMDLVRADRRRRLHLRQRRQRHAAGDDGVGRVHDLRRHLPDGQPPPPERPREAVEAAVLRRRQRDLGLRRQHAPRVLRRRVPPLRHLRQELRPQQAHLPRRGGRERRGLQLDRGADGRAPAGGWTACRSTTTRCRPATGATKGSATGFDEDQWFSTLAQDAAHGRADHQARRDHGQATTREKKIGLVVDEWGTWYDVEPGTDPGFLYQQNTLRDALVAALNLNIFQRHADRVTMANIAQTVNVLQAMILTDKEKMVLTPTYHVFEMYKVHQGATFLPVELQSPDYAFGQEKIPMVSASATRAADGSAVHLSLANTSPAQALTLSVKLAGLTPKSVAGRVLTAHGDRRAQHLRVAERGPAGGVRRGDRQGRHARGEAAREVGGRAGAEVTGEHGRGAHVPDRTWSSRWRPRASCWPPAPSRAPHRRC